jgi:hypothetical protein
MPCHEKRSSPEQIRTAVAGSRVLKGSDFKTNQYLEPYRSDAQISAIDRKNAHENGSATDYVTFTKEELDLFLKIKTNGLTLRSIQLIRQVAWFIWDNLKGKINQYTLQDLAEFYLSRYSSNSARHKCFVYTRLFLMYLYKSRMDTRLLSYHAIFEKPKNRKFVKQLTSRVITVDDVRSLITAIEGDRSLPKEKKLDYVAQVLFLAFSGQRVITAARLTVGQFREALENEHQALKIEAVQDKNRMAHICILHSETIQYLQRLIANRSDDELMFNYLSLQRWLKNHPVQMIHTPGKIELKDLRKFFEQKSDELGFTDAHKNFVMSHGVSSVSWQSYKAFLSENIYKVYTQAWANVSI